MKKIFCALLAFMMVCMPGCTVSGPQRDTPPKYQNYRDIPDVTQDEIAALEALLAKKPRLVYGFSMTTEAFLQDDGTVGGFAALFCRRLSELFGFTLEMTLCSWDELKEKIISTEVDLAGDFTATPERLEQFLMTDPIVQRTIKVYSRTDGTELREIMKRRPVRCIFLQGSITHSLVDSTWDIPFEPVFVDSQFDIPGLLQSGQADAFIEEGILEAAFDAYDFIKAEDYYPLSYSPVSLTTGNPELEPLISIMQKYLRNGGYYELTELYNEGYQAYLKHKLTQQLTDAEKSYLTAHIQSGLPIPAACEVDNYPISFYNKEEREFQGITLDILAQITALTGLTFAVANQPDALWPDLLEGLEFGQYAVVSELVRTNQRAGRFLWANATSFSNKYALLSKAEYPDIDINQVLFSRIGLLEDAAYTDVFNEWFPDSINTITYPNNEQAIRALEKGEVDLLMASQNFLLYLTNYLEKPGFKANIVFDASMDSFLGFHKDEEILRSIVSKALVHVPTSEISVRWQQKSFDYQRKMLKDAIPYLVTFTVLLLAGIFVILILFVKNKRFGKNLEKLVAQRTSELALQTSTLTTIFESMPDLVFCKDLHFNYTRCNPSMEAYFGLSRGQIIGKNDEEGLGLPPEKAELFKELDRKVIREGRTDVTEESVPSHDGTARLFETIKTPLRKDGDIVGIMGIARDITQRKAAEETLKLTLDNLDTCIYITELETGKILFINDRMSEEFGGKDFHGGICWEVLQNGYTERCDFCPIPKLQASGDKYYVWEEHNTVTGKYYKNTDSIIKWHDGQLVHMQHSVDITDSVMLQRELEHASKAKSDFLSRMSHEIRTPLNAIIGMNSIALQTNDLAKIRHCHERVDNASKHLLSLINDILDMSKIEADKFELSHSEFNFEKMLMNITNVTNFRAEEKRQNLVVKLSDDVPVFFVGDELRLSQVITNLLTNAVKFTPERGTIVLGIETIGQIDDEFTLKIAVTDNGIGISPEHQKRLFSSFEQADGSISRKFGGTGLGLAISKRIVELMGGQIWIESELGQGSRFIFTVKLQKGKELAHSQLSARINREQIRILAVDDCAESRDYFSHLMSAYNLPFDVAAGGSEALAKVQSCGDKPYNLFFIDWQMPEMDGIELTRRIKTVTGDNAVVIMVSVADWNNIEKEALEAGVSQFIPKPLFPSTLISTINECLGAESHKAEADVRMRDPKSWHPAREHTILIAEDVEINREIMSAILEHTGLSIEFAEDGRAAVSLFTEHPERYSLIFMDIQMPEMDGYEATRMIRSGHSPQAKEIPIVAMTANVFREDIENCLAAGMNDHVGKPIDQDDLFAKLAQYLT